MLEANFWQDKDKSKKILKEKKLLEEMSSSYLNIENELKDAEELFEIANNENNLEILSDLTINLKTLKKTVKQNEVSVFYQMKQTLWMLILKYTLELVGLKVKIGLKC